MSMRSSNPDFDAVAAALRPEQLRTLRDYANARGTEELWAHATSRNVGVVLAVHNIVQDLCSAGLNEKQALARAAAELDLDYESLQRHRRADRRKSWTG